MKTGIIVAMQSEFDLVAENIKNPQIKQLKHLQFIEGQLGSQNIILIKSGIGKVSAASTTVELINNFSPTQIINTGVAGGLDKNLSVSDIVIGNQNTYHDVWCGEGCYGQIQGLPAKFQASSSLLNFCTNIKCETKIHHGLIVSGDKFITELSELQNIKHNFPDALAVDMESTAIAQVCYLYNIPFISIRMISDTPGIENHYNQYLDFWKLAPKTSFSILKQILDH